MIEQVVASNAEQFIGNLASTFSFAIVQQRDLLGHSRDSLRLWGMPDAILPADQLDKS
eukprot:SAG31_NODE_3224_length_4521_cov_1.673677_2_plen_58_part_00